jgi:hypothetical protein
MFSRRTDRVILAMWPWAASVPHGGVRRRQCDAASIDHRQHSFDHRERDVRATDLAREVEERIRRGTRGHQSLAVDEHVTRLRVQLLPLVERAHRTARENIEAIRRTRQVPAMRVERAEAVNIRLMAP